MFGRLNRVLQFGSLLAWAILVIMLWDRARNIALVVLAAGALMGALTLLTWRLQRRAENEIQQGGGTTDSRSAHLLVTKMLGQLTRVQVAYLGQSFTTPQQGKAWLKRALPRGYRPAINEMYEALEAARSGEGPEGTHLACRLHALRDQLDTLDRALTSAAKRHGECDVAHPAAFVITEEIALDKETGEPPIVLVAAWNPRRETLIPVVDQLTVIENVEGRRRVRGQLAFAKAVASRRLRRDPEDRQIYLANARSEDADELELDELPLGFVLSGSDMV